MHNTGASKFTGGPIACVGGKSATPCVAGDAGAGPGHETMVSSKLGQIS